MKLFLTVAILMVSMGLTAGNIVLEGRYQQRNIFVINGASPDGVGFCTYEVTVNGLITTDEINSQAFEIDLAIYSFKLGDPLTIIIKHKDGCLPKVLNPGALEPAPTFDCSKIDCSTAGSLSWETSNEMGKLPFVIQQFKWNKWVNIGEVMGNGSSGKNQYKFQVPLTSGKNKFRVVQKSYEGELRKSQTCEVLSTSTPIEKTYDRKTKLITFTAETAYELYNVYGQIVKRGFGLTIDCTSLPKGEYYLSYDSKTEKILRK
jgi:hypothetical protein